MTRPKELWPRAAEGFSQHEVLHFVHGLRVSEQHRAPVTWLLWCALDTCRDLLLTKEMQTTGRQERKRLVAIQKRLALGEANGLGAEEALDDEGDWRWLKGTVRQHLVLPIDPRSPRRYVREASRAEAQANADFGDIGRLRQRVQAILRDGRHVDVRLWPNRTNLVVDELMRRLDHIWRGYLKNEIAQGTFIKAVNAFAEVPRVGEEGFKERLDKVRDERARRSPRAQRTKKR